MYERVSLPELSVIVPTKNEGEGIRTLVERTAKSLRGIDHEIVFVDDSNDNTPLVIERISRSFPQVRLIHRKGVDPAVARATADLRGIAEAKGKWVCFINADLQHPPEVIPKLLRKAKSEKADIVVATRYQKGGSSLGLGGLKRKAISFAYNLIVRVLFFQRVHKVTDPGSGFFLFRKGLTDKVQLRTVGFKTLLEILIRCEWQKVEEVSYVFQPRAYGESKADFRQGVNLIKHLVTLTLEVPHAARFWKYSAVGTAGMLVNSATYHILYNVFGVGGNLSWFVSWFGAWIVAVNFNFVVNQTVIWTDRQAGSQLRLAVRIVSFWLSRATGLGVNFIVYTPLIFLGTPGLLANFVGILAGMVVNFTLADKLVFRKQKGG